MANITSMLSIGQRNDICSEDIINNCINAVASNIGNDCNSSKALENLQCFVCDAKIQGRHYALATCKTQTSRTRVIEKLGELVGERYMVVISEDDVICRSCANLINILDRLDAEMCNVRSNVLRFLEQKYSLAEGELLSNSIKQKRSQPPQITKNNNRDVTIYETRKEDVILSSNTTNKPGHKKSNIWLQCDKCQYTALHNSFMVHHTKDHVKQKIFCDKCGVQFCESQQELHNCDINLKSQIRIQDKQQETCLKDISDSILNIPMLEKSMQQNIPIMSIETYSQSQILNRNENIPIIRLSNSENLSMQHIFTSDSTSATGQSLYVRVLQPIEVNEETPTHPTMIMSNSDTDLVMKLKDNTEKQILTLTEDGNLEMTEMACWNDIQSSESQSNMMFQ